MKFKTIYLRAAKLIASGKHEFSCNAIGLPLDSAREFYARTMSPWGYRKLIIEDIYEAVNVPWEISRKREPESIRLRNFRILLLCMMAAACEDFDAS